VKANKKLIIVDGNSQDQSHDIIRKYIKYNSILWLKYKDRGMCDAYNHGLKHLNFSKNEIYCQLGSDDILQDNIYNFDINPNTQFLLNKNNYDWWIEFTALFNNGVLQSITLNKCTKELASIRLEREAQWQKDLEEEEAKWHNVARKFLREHTPWSKLWLKAARVLDNASGKVSSFIYRNIA
jgi:glycosyltransferase involved in cell wall biosynthesis